MIHYKVWYWLEEINDAIIPGRGQLIGFDVKRDFFNPTDLIPVVGPLGKLYKASKLIKHGRKIKYYVWAGIGLASDVYIVEWYNNRYRNIVDSTPDDEPTESPSPSQSGNADDKINGGGGTKKNGRVRSFPQRFTKGGYRRPCPKGFKSSYTSGRWYCVRK